MKLKTKLLASAGSLVLAGSVIAAAAPAAHAAQTTLGACQGGVSFVKLTSPTKGVGLTDRTVDGVKAVGALAKDQTTKALVNGGGTCTGHWRPGDPHNPGHVNTDAGFSGSPTAQATSLLGNATCAQGGDTALDTAATDNAWPLNGKITWTFANNTYTDPITSKVKKYTMQADVALLGIAANGDGADVVSLGGIVLSGVNSGAMLATFANSGAFHTSIWEDPVSKTGGASGFNTGYELDLASAAGCADGNAGGETATQGNANILQVLTGGGGASATSLLGSSANGLVFVDGQP
ncbi:MAG TPA: hypothetical protein VFL67_06920 [Mycobacterium sp.]|nr:hypothetical protein [Mycobacterium sp.]